MSRQTIRLSILPGKASPGPLISPQLGQKKVNIIDFCKQFNTLTINYTHNLPLPIKVVVTNGMVTSLTIGSPSITTLIKHHYNVTSFPKSVTNTLPPIPYHTLLKIAKIKHKSFSSFLPVTNIKSIIGTLKTIGIPYDLK